MKKILLITHPLILSTAGGAEKVFVNMANDLVKRGYEIVALCNSEERGLPFYQLDEKVKFINLYYETFDDILNKSSCNNFLEEFLCKNFIFPEDFDNAKKYSDKFEKLLEREKPDLIICHFMHLYREAAYCKNYAIPVIIMMHSEPDRFFTFFGKKYFKLNRLALNKADAVQVLLHSHVETIKKYYYGEVSVIGNAVESITCGKNANLSKKKEKYTILNISRLDKFKRQDLLIKAFALIAPKYPDWEVHLYGQFQPAEHQSYIESLTKKHNLEYQVKYLGVTDSPVEKLEHADIFVLPSDFEGFSLATAEAMSVGLPCIGFKDCGGVNELILHNITGFLTEKTPEDLAKHLEILINNAELRVKFGENSKERIQEFSPDIIWDKWENLIKQTILGHKNIKFKIGINYIKTLFKAL